MSLDTSTTGIGSGPIVIAGLDGLQARAGTKLGVSEWVDVTQRVISTFAELTGDEQWIHVDPERARDSRYGNTIQHGFLTLSISTGLMSSVCTVSGYNVILNYGLNKVRFPAPLKVGARVRMHAELAEVTEIAGGAQAVYHLIYEVESEPKPCCVADVVFRYYM